MLFPIILFLMVLSPLYIPVAVTVVDVYSNWRSNKSDRPVRAYRPMAAPMPAAA